MTVIYDSGYVPGGCIKRTAPPVNGHPTAIAPITSALIAINNPSFNKSYEWMALDWMDDHSLATGKGFEPENVARYTKYNRYGTAAGWGVCIEVRNPGGSEMPLHGLELDLCTDGNDPKGHYIGAAIYYGAQTDTFKAGPDTTANDGLRIHPFRVERNGLRRGISIEGRMEQAAIQVGTNPESNIRNALEMGPGSTLKWNSEPGKFHEAAWHSLEREFSVLDFPVIGLIDIVVDDTVVQIPVFRKTV
jgi:hypothetical protein